jgi:ParB family chromosome partitioning protein
MNKAKTKKPASKSLNKKAKKVGEIFEVSIIDILLNPRQPRRIFNNEKIKELSDSIKQYGLLQPVIVTKVGNNYELVSGERRLRASRMAGFKRISAILKENDFSDQRKLELALIENIQRENLSEVDEAIAYKELVDDFGLNQDEIATKMNKSRSSIANKLRLLKLPETILEDLRLKNIDFGHAKLLLSLENSELQIKTWKKMKEKEMTVRELDSEVKRVRPDKKWRSLNKCKDEKTKEEEDKLKDIFETRVSILKRGNGAKVVFNFYSKEDYDAFLKKVEDYDYFNI